MADQDVLLERRRRLGGELRRLREQAGLSGRELAKRMDISQSKVSRIEAGAVLPTVPEVADWTSATAASDFDSDMLKMLTDTAYTEIRAWDDVLRGQAHLQDSVRDLENKVRVKRTYEPSVVPGLLQTPEYARRLFTMFQPPYAEHDLRAAVVGRLDRQTALFDPKRQFDFLITEAALRLRIGPAGMMAAQLDRIATLSTLENVDIGLIPADAPMQTHVPHGFSIFEFPEDSLDPLVLTETVHANLTVSMADHVALYQEHWQLLKKAARFGDAARDFLATVAGRVRETSGQEP